MEKQFTIIIIIISVAIIMISVGLGIAIRDAEKEAYCNSLEFREYFENKDCRRFMK